MTPRDIREVICPILLKVPDLYNWSDYPNVWNEVIHLIEQCLWFKVYDIAEALYKACSDGYFEEAESYGEDKFASDINKFFRENGIGWQMDEGKIVFRGSEIFESATREAAHALIESGRPRAADEIRKALSSLSQRPETDETGAINHAMGALEATARDLTGKPNAELGKLIPELNLPRPLDIAIDKLWGYSSDRARHIREGQSVNPEEAELVVSVAAAVCTFLAKRSLA